MRGLLNGIIAKCTVAFEVTGQGCRLTGTGLVGVIAVGVLLAFLLSRAPDLLHFFVSK